uniref:Probable RNA polymerase II nuclear localization protein SLC7A6OS n=1 Tax=Caenorhabditis japonica TaxID=281687 RepID=A0A8R1I5P6_CAEJA
MNSPLIRVSRKRTADPHDALILQSKRAKQAAPVVFTLFKAAADGNDMELEGANVLDLPPQEQNLQADAVKNPENPLGFVQDEAVGLVGEVEQQKRRSEEPVQVSLNGRLLQPVAPLSVPESSEDVPDSEDVVFDYYRIHEKRGNTWNSEMTDDIHEIEVKFANRDELDLAGGEDSDGPPADDDDDSNDEDNWRNDYPDEDSYDE